MIGVVLLIVLGWLLNNIDVADYSAYRWMVPVATLFCLAGLVLIFKIWKRSALLPRLLLSLMALLALWELHDMVFRRLPALFSPQS